MPTKPRTKRYATMPSSTWIMIRRHYEQGVPPAELCRRYGVSQSTLFSRRKREEWERVKSDCAIAGEMSFVSMTTSPHTDEAPAQLSVVTGDTTNKQLSVCVGDFAPPASTASRGIAVSEAHLRMAADLRLRIDELTTDIDLGAGTHGRRSRAAVDLATAVEKLQKIERTALGLDHSNVDVRSQVVIIVPQKMDQETWEESARKLFPVSANADPMRSGVRSP